MRAGSSSSRTRTDGSSAWRTSYTEPEEIQKHLDEFLEYYNLRRSHQGYRLVGRTPAQALRDALDVEELPPFTPKNSTTPEGGVVDPCSGEEVNPEIAA